MKVSKSLAVSILAVLISVPLAAQVNDTYVIPVVGNVAGGGGTRWASEFAIFNPQGHPLKVSLVYLPSGVGAAQEILFTIEPNETLTEDNILDSVFELSGTGSLLVATFPEDNPSVPNDTLSRSFLVRSNTYNNASSGTYGQAIPGVWAGLLDFESDEISAVSHGIRNYGTVGRSGFRTNIGAVNLGRTSVRLRLNVIDFDGTVLARNLPFTVPPQGHFQQGLDIELEGGSVEFFLEDPSREGVVFPYASVVDNRSGDPVYINPILLASPSVLFKGQTAAGRSGTDVGKKIDTAIARSVRNSAVRLGEVQVVRERRSARFARSSLH